MAIGGDFSIDSSKNIRYEGAAHGVAGAGYYTVLEFHRWLQDLADDASSTGDDLLDITKPPPSDKQYDTIITLTNSYNIDQEASEHLYGGSIIQNDGDDIWDGVANYGTEGIHIEIMQNGALVANDFWNSIPDGESTKGLNRDIASGISHQFMLQVRSSGSDIDGRRLIGMNREFNYTYDEFKINGTSRGVNVLALTHTTDLNNQTAAGTVSGWTNITNTEGYRAIDVNGDSTDEYYYSEWNRDTQSINDLYERIKWLTRRGSTSTIYGLNGDLFRGITHEIDVDNPSGTFSAVEEVSWPTGTGQMFAINNTTAPTKMWIQLLTGVAPTDGSTITGATSSATCDVNTTVTERSITIAGPSGLQSTGTAIIGSYGLGVEAADLSSSDRLTDLTDTQRTPPNNVTFYVLGLISGEDYVLVGPESAGVIEEDQLSASGTYSGGEATFTVQESIPGDTPTTGTFRVWNGSTYSRVTYTGWASSSFTGCSGVPACSNGDNVWISYVDKLADSTSLSFTGVYQSDRSLIIKARDGGVTPIKPFESTATLGTSGGSITIIRTSDA
jgi:hypothetical protein